MGFMWGLDVCKKTKLAENAKVYDIFGFEKLNEHHKEATQQEVKMKSDVYVNLPNDYGKSVVFQALPQYLLR